MGSRGTIVVSCCSATSHMGHRKPLVRHPPALTQLEHRRQQRHRRPHRFYPSCNNRSSWLASWPAPRAPPGPFDAPKPRDSKHPRLASGLGHEAISYHSWRRSCGSSRTMGRGWETPPNWNEENDLRREGTEVRKPSSNRKLKIHTAPACAYFRHFDIRSPYH